MNLTRQITALSLIALAGGCFGDPELVERERRAVTTEDPDVHVVTPTGDPQTDLANVQAAVDLGGTVLLASRDEAGIPTAFAFGEPPFSEAIPGWVRPASDVAIVGEDDGEARTTIRGGYHPILVRAPIALRVENIVFDQPWAGAITITRARGADIVGNEIVGVRGVDIGFATEGRGIKLLGSPDEPITGQVRIANNYVHDLQADLSRAIVAIDVAADLVISDNRLEDDAMGGVLVSDPLGDVLISRNTIRPGPYLNGFSWGNGIDLWGSRGGQYVVELNDIHCENELADGILVVSGDAFGNGPIDGAVIRGNDIRIPDDHWFGYIAIYDNLSNSYIGQNRFSGSGLYGVALFPTGWTDDYDALDNALVGNSLTNSHALLADYLLFSHTERTLVRGNGGTVLDLGTDNYITGSTPMNGAPTGLDTTRMASRVPLTGTVPPADPQ